MASDIVDDSQFPRQSHAQPIAEQRGPEVKRGEMHLPPMDCVVLTWEHDVQPFELLFLSNLSACQSPSTA